MKLAVMLVAVAVAVSAETVTDLCRQCDKGTQSACDKLVKLHQENGVNVCVPNAKPVAAKGEFNPDLVEGDMIIPEGGSSRAAGTKIKLWPYGVVPYEIVTGGYFTNSEISVIKAAMNEISSKTCIRFKQRTNEKEYVKINPYKSGCFSAVGRDYYQPQSLNLAKECLQDIGTPAHELMHALGFFHEQSRPDRDQYIWLDLKNTYKPDQFEKETKDTATTSNTNYDYGSVMHYPTWAFAIDQSRNVITPKQQGVEIGQRKGLSALDAYEINTVYQYCRKGGAVNCYDTDSKCAQYAKQGYCTTNGGGWKTYMESHCIKSCKLCS